MNTRVGQTFGAYRLTALLGRSAYAEVYLGEHTRVQRQAVIKLLALPLPAGGWTAFQQTCSRASRLVHPGIVPVLDFDQQDGTVFLVREYLPTGSLGHHCPPGAHVPLQQVAGWVQQVAEALFYAHSHQVLHLGLKPSNLLFNQQQEIVVSDFGLAAFARPLLPPQGSTSAESLTYLAPEQLRGQAGQASDQYALAICAYEWLRGAPPFQGELATIIAGHLSTPPPPLHPHLPDLPVEVEQALLTALRKNPAERFGSLQAFAHAFIQASGQANKTPAFVSPVPGIQAPSTLLNPTQPASASAPVPADPGSPVPTAPSSLTLPPPNWAQASPGLDQMALPPYPQPSEPASASPHISRRAAITGAVGVGAAGVLTTLCTRTAWFSSLVKSLSSHGASAAATPTVSSNPLLYTYRGHTRRPLYSLCWSPDSTKLISIDASATPLIHVWDALTGSHASTFDSRSIQPANLDLLNQQYLAWTTSGPCIGWIDRNQPVVHVTNLVSGQEVSSHRFSPSDGLTDLGQVTIQWSPNGHYLAVVTVYPGGIFVLEAATGNLVATFLPPDSKIFTFDCVWSPDSQRVAAIYDSNAISIWEISSGRQLSNYQKYANVAGSVGLVWSSDSQSLASVCSIPQIDIWNAQSGSQLYTYPNMATNIVDLVLLGWSADNRLFATGIIATEKTSIWDASTYQLQRTLPTEIFVQGWAPGSSRLAVQGTVPTSDGEPGSALTVWDAATGQQLTAYKHQEDGLVVAPNFVNWSPNGKYMASIYSLDNGIYIWRAP